MKTIAVILFFLTIASPSFAVDEAFDKLLIAKSLKCELGPGVSTEWDEGKIKTESGKFGSSLHFDSIDLEKGTARIIGNQGAEDILSILTLAGISFVETTGLGNMILTTVFFEYTDKNSKQYKMVQSRHVSLMSNAFPSQYYGNCKIWDM